LIQRGNPAGFCFAPWCGWSFTQGRKIERKNVNWIKWRGCYPAPIESLPPNPATSIKRDSGIIRDFGRNAVRLFANLQICKFACDVLIALCAVNADAELVTVNAAHFEIWKRILARSGKNLSLSVVSR